MRSALRIALLGIVVATGACSGYRRAATVPEPGARVRIVLTTAQDVATVAALGARQVHPGVLEVSGTMQAAAADTLAVRLGDLHTAAGALPGLTGQTALIPAAAIASMERRQLVVGERRAPRSPSSRISSWRHSSFPS